VLRACTKEMVAWVRPAVGSGAGSADLQLDIDLCDAQGRVCVQMRGLTHERQAHGAAGIVLAPTQASGFDSNTSAARVQVSLSTEA
jgi:hypothetical protein